MGLDIQAYSKIKLIDTAKDADDYDSRYWTGLTPAEPKTFCIYRPNVENPDFPQQIEGANLTPDGVYTFEESHDFRAGSYSGYNRWREWLCTSFTGGIPQNVWKRPNSFKDRPFFLLVNFSDCEGVIAGPSAVRLLEDFEAHREQAAARSTGNEFLDGRYEHWLKAFRLAADDGLVYFR